MIPRLRTTVSAALNPETPAFRMALSPHIAAGGEATTAQLTSPGGTFTAGRLLDDEVRTPQVDLAAGGYTEHEWCIVATSGTPSGTYHFSVATLEGGVLDTYPETLPSLTVAGGVLLEASGTGTSSGSVMLSRRLGIVASGTGSASGTVRLSRTLGIAGSGTGTATGSVGITILRKLAASGSGASSGQATLGRRQQLVASGSGIATGSGNLVIRVSMEAVGQGGSSGSVILRRLRGLRATGTGVASGSAELESLTGFRVMIAPAGVASWLQEQQLFEYQNQIDDVDMAFGPDGRPVVAFVSNSEVILYWYDPQLSNYRFTNFGQGRTPRLVTNVLEDNSVILMYFKPGMGLVTRSQGTRFTDERTTPIQAYDGHYLEELGWSDNNELMAVYSIRDSERGRYGLYRLIGEVD